MIAKVSDQFSIASRTISKLAPYPCLLQGFSQWTRDLTLCLALATGMLANLEAWNGDAHQGVLTPAPLPSP